MSGMFFLAGGVKALLVFLGLSVALGGAAAFAAGRALAKHWRPVYYLLLPMVPIAVGVRFLHYALFDKTLLSWPDFVADYVVALASAFLGFTLTRKMQMRCQYGWLPQRKR